MFCLYSPCSPSAYLPLQRPMPLWAAPTVPPIGSGISLGPGLPRGEQPDLSEAERRAETGGRKGGLPLHFRGKDGEGLPLQDGGRPFFFLRGPGLPGKRRRSDSPGRAPVIFGPPPPHSPGGLQHFTTGKYPSDLDSPPFGEKSSPASIDSSRWETPVSPGPPSRNHSGSKDSRIEKNQREEEEEDEEGVQDADEEAREVDSADHHQTVNHRIPQDVSPPNEASSAVVMTTVAIGNKWPTTPPFESPRRRSGDPSAIHRRNHLQSPSASAAQCTVPSPTPTMATKHGGVLKFGIDSILRSKDTHEGNCDENIIPIPKLILITIIITIPYTNNTTNITNNINYK